MLHGDIGCHNTFRILPDGKVSLGEHRTTRRLCQLSTSAVISIGCNFAALRGKPRISAVTHQRPCRLVADPQVTSELRRPFQSIQPYVKGVTKALDFLGVLAAGHGSPKRRGWPSEECDFVPPRVSNECFWVMADADRICDWLELPLSTGLVAAFSWWILWARAASSLSILASNHERHSMLTAKPSRARARTKSGSRQSRGRCQHTGNRQRHFAGRAHQDV